MQQKRLGHALGTTTVPTRSTSFRAGAVAIILLTLTWRIWTMSQWSWFQDDWVYLNHAASMPFWANVSQNYNGHIMPAQFAIVSLLSLIAPLNYSVALLPPMLSIAIACTAWTFALRELFGERLRLLLPILLFCMSPLLMPITLWWAASMQIFPLLAAQALCILFVARYKQRGNNRRDLLLSAAALLAGLLFWEKAILTAIPMAFTAFALTDGTIRRRLEKNTLIIATVSALSAAYACAYLFLTRLGDAAQTTLLEPRSLTESFNFFSTGALDIGLPALLGGPWSTVADPQQVFTTSSGLLTLCLLAVGVCGSIAMIIWRRDGVLALTFLLAYAGVSWGLLLTSSRFDILGTFLVRDARYAADILPIALIVATFGVTPLRHRPDNWLRRSFPLPSAPLRKASFVVACGIAASSLIVSGLNWDRAAPNSPKPWVENLVSDAKSAGAVSVYDSLAPRNVIDPAYFVGDGRLQQLLKPLGLTISWNEPAETIYVPDWAGHLREARITPASVNAEPGPVQGCGYAVAAGQQVSIPMKPALFNWEWGFEIDYFAGGPANLTVATDRTSQVIHMERGLHRRQFVVTDSAKSVNVRAAEDSNTICITAVRGGPVEASDRWIGDLSPKTTP